MAFVSTRAVMARALVEKASKLSKPDNSPVRAHVYYGNMDGKQRQKTFPILMMLGANLTVWLIQIQ